MAYMWNLHVKGSQSANLFLNSEGTGLVIAKKTKADHSSDAYAHDSRTGKGVQRCTRFSRAENRAK